MEHKVCPSCSKEWVPGARRCGHCGLPLSTQGAPPPPAGYLDGDPEAMRFLGGEPPGQYQPVDPVKADPLQGYLGRPKPEAAEDARRRGRHHIPQSFTPLHGLAIGARNGGLVAAFLGFLAALLAVGMGQAEVTLGSSAGWGIFLVTFLQYLMGGIIAGALIGGLAAALGSVNYAWLIGLPLGLLYWAVVQLPLLRISNEHVTPFTVTQGLLWFGLAGAGFGHLVGRLIASHISHWD